MKRKGLLFIIISIVLGVSTFFSLYMYINKMDDRIGVVVAAQDIEPLQEIKEDMITIEYKSKTDLQGSYTSKKQNISGFYSDLIGLHKGEVITREKVKKKDEIISDILNRELPEGKRAVAAEVDFVRSVSGSVKPGDYVDISVVTEKYEVTPIESIKIISVKDKEGNEIGYSREKIPMPASVVFEADPETRDIIVYISSKGSIYLSLRNTKDIKETEVKKDTLDKLEAPLQNKASLPESIPEAGQTPAYSNF